MRAQAGLPLLLLLAAAGSAALAAPAAPQPDVKIAPWLRAHLAATGTDSFIVLFDDAQSLDAALAPLRERGTQAKRRDVYDALSLRARTKQAAVRAELRRAGISFRPLYIVNGLAVRGDIALARRLARHGEIVRIIGDPVVRGVDVDLLAPVPATPATVEWGVNRIEADKVWTLDGNRGEGIVVASADTGVNWQHPALKGKYRGWDGVTANHDFNWFDAVQNVAAPFDPYSVTHGTHTTGTMIGDDGLGNQVGVAPGAKWIACRNMDSGGNGQPSTYMACNQFFLAPFPYGGDPELDGDPSKAPDIVNNSWGCPTSEGCDPETLLASFRALASAGILAVVSAGNSGSGCTSVLDAPAIYKESFSVGATDSGNFVSSFSSRGPVTVDGSGRLKPDVVAPGSSVRSATGTSTYGTLSGTSMAGPHVAGTAALLWSAKPQARGRIALTRCLITRSARGGIVQLSSPQTCGGTTAANRPNNMFGYGLIDAYDAIHLAPDGDGDGIADACDCAPADGSAFLPPQEVDDLVFHADKTTLAWGPIVPESGETMVYDAIRGSLADLEATGGIAAATCLGSAGPGVTVTDPDVPAVGEGSYYLIGSRDVCASGFGEAWNGAARAHATCP